MDAVKELDQLIATLDGAVGHTVAANGAGDAIERMLEAPDRATRVRSLRDSPALVRFRAELVRGAVRTDTAARSLRLVRQLVRTLVATGG